MIQAQVQSTSDGAILFDPALAAAPRDEWFDCEYWRELGQAASVPGGRGGVTYVETPVGPCALRHYHRGGLVARVSADRYFWLAAARTRSFAEFRLLAKMDSFGLPVPVPVAARYVRHGASYQADLLTRRIASAHTLAARLHDRVPDPALGERVGRTIARFHAAGVWHADLNAHNILVDERGKVWLIDFDRGRLRRPLAMWRRSNLRRLRRSLEKVGASAMNAFDSRFWDPLLAAYRPALVQALPSAAPRGTLS